MDVAAVTDDTAAAASGVAHAAELLDFVEAAVAGEEARLAAARQGLLDAVGPDALVDAAAVVGNFERMTRIADATGIPLDGPVVALSSDLRERLGVGDFASARNTPTLAMPLRLLGRALRPIALRLLRWLGFRRKRAGDQSTIAP